MYQNYYILKYRTIENKVIIKIHVKISPTNDSTESNDCFLLLKNNANTLFHFVSDRFIFLIICYSDT